MHAVRVYHNRDRGVLWWAEGDLGFTGGADTLAELLRYIHEWAECEGVHKELEIRLIGDQTLENVPLGKVIGSAEVATRGVAAVRTRFALASV